MCVRRIYLGCMPSRGFFKKVIALISVIGFRAVHSFLLRENWVWSRKNLVRREKIWSCAWTVNWKNDGDYEDVFLSVTNIEFMIYQLINTLYTIVN